MYCFRFVQLQQLDAMLKRIQMLQVRTQKQDTTNVPNNQTSKKLICK